jgi:hypothetical protein
MFMHMQILAQQYSVCLQKIFVFRLCSQEENSFFLPCVYSWPNIEKQLALLYISLVQELATTCIRYYWNNVDVLIVACATAESYAIVEDSERQCPKPLKIYV